MASNPWSVEGMYEALDGFRAKRDALLKSSEDARKRRDAIVAQIAPLEVKLRAINDEIKKLHAPDGPDEATALYHVDQSIANITKALSGKADPRKKEEPAAAG